MKARIPLLLLMAFLGGCSLLRQPEPAPAPPPAPVIREPLGTTQFVLPDADANVVGEIQVVRARAKDTFIDIAMAYSLGYDELIEANPGIDPRLPGEGTEIILPSRFVLPDVPRRGIVLNVASKRGSLCCHSAGAYHVQRNRSPTYKSKIERAGLPARILEQVCFSD